MIHLLQAYRGIAAVFVLAWHATLMLYGYFEYSEPFWIFYIGEAGVQFFFVLSGFIIYFVHKNDLGRPEQLSSYVKKRAIRVYPLYLLISLALIPLFFIVPNMGEPYHRDGLNVVKSLLLLPQDHYPHLSVGWTLTHEVFFYSLFALLIFNKKIGQIFLLSSLALIVACLPFYHTLDFPLTFFLSPNNVLFGLGILAAILITKGLYDVNQHRLALSLFVLGNILFIAIGLYRNVLVKLNPDEHSPFDAVPNVIASDTWITLLFGLASFLIILQSGNRYLEGFFKKRKLMDLLGQASYSIYLIHVPVLLVSAKVLSYLKAGDYLPSYILFLLFVVIGLIAGVVTYYLIERPLLNYFRGRFVKPKKLA